VPSEDVVLAGLLDRGWAVAAGERFRRRAEPAVRITTATLDPADARRLARDLADVLSPAHRRPTTTA